MGDLDELLSGKGKIEFAASNPPFKKPEYPESEWSDEQRSASKSWDDQQRILRKLTEIVTDARDYFNDHGEQALFLGFPLLSLPPSGRDSDFKSSRIGKVFEIIIGVFLFGKITGFPDEDSFNDLGVMQ